MPHTLLESFERACPDHFAALADDGMMGDRALLAAIAHLSSLLGAGVVDDDAPGTTRWEAVELTVTHHGLETGPARFSRFPTAPPHGFTITLARDDTYEQFRRVTAGVVAKLYEVAMRAAAAPG